MHGDMRAGLGFVAGTGGNVFVLEAGGGSGGGHGFPLLLSYQAAKL
jgi:hypothetical protein